MIVNWNAMSYLTAIKDYKSILYSFVAAVLVAFVTSCVLLALACLLWSRCCSQWCLAMV